MKKSTCFAALIIACFPVLEGCHSSSSSATTSQDSVAQDMTAVQQHSLDKQWETDTSLRSPESTLWDAQQQIIYVSNIDGDGSLKDGNGFISQLDASGNIKQLHWLNGLDAPKGLGLYKGTLYVADLAQLVLIDVAAKKVTQKIPLPGASFLNDVTVDDSGHVYVSDSRENKVYRYADGKVTVYLDQPEVKGVNGLLVWHSKLWLLASGGIYTYDASSATMSLFSDAVKGGDGLAAVNDNDLIASRWAGEVYYVNADGTATKLLDTQEAHKNTADICYIPDLQLLVVPSFLGNTIAGYKLK